MYRYEAPGDYPIREVKLKPDESTKLLEFLVEQTRDALSDRSSLEDKWKIWHEQMENRSKREDADPTESQLDLGITAERAQQISSRLENPIHQYPNVYVCKPTEPIYTEVADSAEKILDAAVKRFDFRTFLGEWIEQAQTFSCGWVKTPFVVEKTTVRVWDEVDNADEFDALGEDTPKIEVGFDSGATKRFKEGRREVTKRRGVFPEVVPIEDMIITWGASDVATAPLVTHRVWLTKADVKCRIADGIWPKKVMDANGEMKPTLEVLGKPNAKKKPIISPNSDGSSGSSNQETKQRFYEICESYTERDLKDGPEEIIVWWERESETIVRTVYNWYHSFPRPFVPWAYKNIIGNIYGKPLTQEIEHLHIAYSACINQRLDAASKANEVAVFYDEGTASSSMKKLFDSQRLSGGNYGVQGNPKDQISTFNISQPWTQLPELEGIIEKHADKRTGINDYSFGQEQIGRPTATGQTSLIEEGKQPLYKKLESLRGALAEVGIHILSRMRQFYPAGVPLFNGEEPEILKWPKEAFEESIIVETRVSSQSMNKQMRKEEAMALLDRMTELYDRIMGYAEAATTLGPLAPVAEKVLRGLQFAINRMMEEFDVAYADLINPDLQEEIDVGQMFSEYKQNMEQRVAMLEGQLAAATQSKQGAPPMGGPPGPPPVNPGPGPMAGGPQGQPA